jgi:hypothetical protein
MGLLTIKLEGRVKTYNASRFWFPFAICASTRTSAVFARCFGIGYSDEELRHAVAIALFY